MTPLHDRRELLRDLMRGDRAQLKVGYDGLNATRAVCELSGIDVDDIGPAKELLAYAYGYALGLNHEPLDYGQLCDAHAEHVRDGYMAGQLEDPAYTYHATVNDRERLQTEPPAR